MIQTTVRFEEHFNEKLRIAMAKRRVRSLQQAVDQALETWLESEPGDKAAPPVELAESTKEELAWCGKLVGLLREGEAGTIDLVQHALNRHARQARDRRKQAGS